MALYGCEAAPLANNDTAKLLFSISKAIGPYSSRSANFSSVHLAAPGTSFDPSANVLYRNFALMRRIMAKHAGFHQTFLDIFENYLDKKLPGTIDDDTMCAPKAFCPQP